MVWANGKNGFEKPTTGACPSEMSGRSCWGAINISRGICV